MRLQRRGQICSGQLNVSAPMCAPTMMLGVEYRVTQLTTNFAVGGHMDFVLGTAG